MNTLAFALMIISIFMFTLLFVWHIQIKHKHAVWLNDIFHINDSELISEYDSNKQSKFKLQLLQAGLSKKAFQEVVIASIVAGVSIFTLIFILDLSLIKEIGVLILSLAITIFTPYIYILEQIKARIKRIDNDLSVFLDLLIIILEGGGGLNNAIDEVTTQAKNVIGKDLLEESKRFKYEMMSYGSDIAYTNLVKRTGSESIATIVGYMRLSEETGIGVKTIFENLAQEIRMAQSLEIQKRAATMNISITFTMFIFILPAIIAMIAFAMASGDLMKII